MPKKLILREEVLIQALNLYCAMGASSDVVFDHEIRQTVAVDQAAINEQHRSSGPDLMVSPASLNGACNIAPPLLIVTN